MTIITLSYEVYNGSTTSLRAVEMAPKLLNACRPFGSVTKINDKKNDSDFKDILLTPSQCPFGFLVLKINFALKQDILCKCVEHYTLQLNTVKLNLVL